MTKTLVQRLRAVSTTEIETMYELTREAADELEQLRGNLSLAEEGLANAMQEIARLRDENAGLKNEVAGELAQMARDPALTERARFALGLAKDMLRASHEPSDGPHRAFLEMPECYSGPVKIRNPGAPVAEVTVYKDDQKSASESGYTVKCSAPDCPHVVPEGVSYCFFHMERGAAKSGDSHG